MKYSIALTLAAATGSLAAPSDLARREPSDKSGNSIMAFKCTTISYPRPANEGAGTGLDGVMNSDLTYTDSAGNSHAGSNCVAIDDFCGTCHFEGNGLTAPVDVKTCFDSIGSGCSLEFDYFGYHYDTEKGQPDCGHSNKFAPFGDTKTALCYFDSDKANDDP